VVVVPKAVAVERARLEMVLAPQVLGLSVTAVCDRYQVSRQQFYVWRRRYERDGVAGLSDRSRRPETSPKKILVTMELTICEMRVTHPDWGPRRIRAEIASRGGRPPAKSTVQRVLERNGLVSPRPRPKRTYKRFERPCPNDLWQIDALKVALKGDIDAYVINILDDHARYLLASRAGFVLDGDAAWDAFEAGSVAHGLPRELLSDNGAYFSGQNQDFVAEFERRLWALGINTIPASPQHPQTLGKLERFHRTQREWLRKHRSPATLPQLQRRLDAFRWHYNEERPNQAINDSTPGERYRASAPAKPEGNNQSHSVRRTATKAGLIYYAGWVVNLTSEWAGVTVEVIESQGKVRIVYADELITAYSTDEPKRYLGTGIGRGKHRIPRRLEQQ
jgi:transposase InsO family protein